MTITAAQIGTTVQVDLLGITGAHPAIGTNDLRLIAHEI